jgi:hypothetical protein
MTEMCACGCGCTKEAVIKSYINLLKMSPENAERFYEAVTGRYE